MIPRRTVLAALPPLLATARPASAAPEFAAFLLSVREEAVGAGISPATVDRALAGLRPNPKVLELDSHPPERTQSWERYRNARVSDARVAAGRQAMAANAGPLAVIARRYGVDASVLVAIWGVETNYGGFTGGFPVIEALATLAADGRRDGYFRKELLNALRILDAGDIRPERMTGSYAGAMGQPQFMPSSYLEYAASFDETGRRDIWDSRNDTLASIANYLARFGWRPGETWGQRVRVPPGLVVGPDSRDDRRPVSAWLALGVAPLEGATLLRPGPEAAVVMPNGPGGEAFLVYGNFAVVRLYNHSDLYALSIGVLADRVA